ncbi:fatty acyl-AMP ligase [Streptosporangium sp. NPDC002607]
MPGQEPGSGDDLAGALLPASPLCRRLGRHAEAERHIIEVRHGAGHPYLAAFRNGRDGLPQGAREPRRPPAFDELTGRPVNRRADTRPVSLVAAVRDHAAVHPDRPALSFTDFNRARDGITTTWTYAELDLRARAVAAELLRRCVPGDRAAILCPQGLDYVAAFLGCLYAGVRAVPLYPPESFRGNSRLEALLADAAPALVLTTSSTLPAITRLLAWEPAAAPDRFLAVDEIDPASAARWEPPEVDDDTVAYLQYTSGSTSNPRGVMVTHGNLAHTVAQCERAYGLASHLSVNWLPFFHDMGLASGVTVPLTLGLHTVTMTPFAFVQRPARWLRLISRYRGTFAAAPNFALDLCVDRATPDELEGVDLSCLAVLLNGAEPVRAASLRRFSHAFAPYGFTAAAHTASYGLAEATILVTTTPVGTGSRLLDIDRAAATEGRVAPIGKSAVSADGRAGDEQAPPHVRRLVGCGVPAGQRITIVDPDSRAELPPGRIGEVWVRGPNVTAGYHGLAERTREVFQARLLDDAAGEHWLRTGDLGFLHDGHLYLAGRHKDLIVVNGRNHHPADIEATVETAHACVRAGHVVAFGVDTGDTERLIVIAEMDPRALNGDGSDGDGLLRAVRRVVADRHGIEAHDLLMVCRGQIPMTSSGKPRRADARRRYLDGEYKVVTFAGRS